MSEDYKPRFSFEITEEQRIRANRLLVTYGLRRAIFGKILDGILDLVEVHGGMAIGALMSPDVDSIEILLKRMANKKETDNGKP